MPARFCEQCGAPSAPLPSDPRAPLRCARCGHVRYRNSKPCVGAIIERDGHVLLSLRARDPHRGEWDLPGGFLETGEHPEEGIVRELREETGAHARVLGLVHVGVGTYDEHDTLNLVYRCELDREAVAHDDSAALRWWPLDALPPMAFPHEREALEKARAQGQSWSSSTRSTSRQ